MNDISQEAKEKIKEVSAVSAKIIWLRKKTGLGILKCKQALEATEGDETAALDYLRKQGEIISNSLTKPATEGAIFSYVHHTGQVAAMVELRCQTDFVARNDEFKAFGAHTAMVLASLDADRATADHLLEAEFYMIDGMTVQEALNQLKAKMGENIELGKIVRLEVGV